MFLRFALASLLLCSTGLLGMGKCHSNAGIIQANRSIPGHLEPNTPGAPGVLASAKLESLLGPDPDLNRVSYIRTFRGFPRTRPNVVLIVIPGFLGGATTFDPIARDLVREGDGDIEVWAVDRRPNQLEDQLGGNYAREGVEDGDLDAIFEGAQFYFSDLDKGTPAFPIAAEGDLDLNLNGVFDAQLPLVDEFGASRLPILFTQDEVRPFAAHWGIDLYMRDWKLLVEKARTLVGPGGHVFFGGHSQGTSWTARFAAYDFDPGPGVVAGHSLVDGLILFEGGGLGPPSGTPPTPAEYDAALTDLQTPGGGSIFLGDLPGAPGLTLVTLGTIGQVAALAGVFVPDEPSLIQRTTAFGQSILGALINAPSTNEAVAGFFLDDDYSANPAFRAGLGYSTNGPNALFNPLDVENSIYIPVANPGGVPLRTWRDSSDPALAADSTCKAIADRVAGDSTPDDGVGCALNLERNPNDAEVSSIVSFLRTQYEVNNGFEWYFLTGRVSLDFAYGNDSSSLGDESKLAITQTASMDAPVLGIGGDNGLANEASDYDTYFGTIATPADQKKACILPGYAHVDPLTATDNLAVPLVLDFIASVQNGGTVDADVICP